MSNTTKDSTSNTNGTVSFASEVLPFADADSEVDEPTTHKGNPRPPKKPPRNYHYSSMEQMASPSTSTSYTQLHPPRHPSITTSSSASTTSTSKLHLQQQQHPIRIAQPPPPHASQQQPQPQPRRYYPSQYGSYTPYRQPQFMTNGVHAGRPVHVQQSSTSSLIVGGCSRRASIGTENHPALTTTFPSQQQKGGIDPSDHPFNRLRQHMPPAPFINGPPLDRGTLHHNSAPQLPSNSNRVNGVKQHPPSNQTSDYNKFVQIALQQQRQIQANELELMERRQVLTSTAISNGTVPAPILPSPSAQELKERITKDEEELARLSGLKTEVQQLQDCNRVKRHELSSLENASAYATDGAELRRAARKVDMLRKQLDLLHQRRASAASAAIAQQRMINYSGETARSTLNPTTSVSFGHQPPSRPRASVVPFRLGSSIDAGSPVLNSVVDKGRDEVDGVCNPRRSVAGSPQSHQQRNGNDVDRVSLRSDTLSAVKRRSLVLADYHQNGQLPNGSVSNAPAGDYRAERNIWRYLIEEQKKGRTHISFADIMAARKQSDHSFASTTPNGSSASVSTIVAAPTCASPTITASATVREQRSDKPRPKPIIGSATPLDELDFPPSVAKAASNGVSVAGSPQKETTPHQGPESEPAGRQQSSVEETGATASKEQSKGITTAPRASIDEVEVEELEDFEVLSSDIFADFVSKTEVAGCEKVPGSLKPIEEENPQGEEPTGVGDADNHDMVGQGTSTFVEEETNDFEEEEASSGSEDEDSLEEPPEFAFPLDEFPVGELNLTAAKVAREPDEGLFVDEDSSSLSCDSNPVAFDEDSTAAVVPTKSILSTGTGNRGVIQKERSVVFDPTVLFLDVAYEGEYELLVELAAKIADISVANGEGITALHNGICAGNHDIVKFLIDHHANVNALDSDGWTPLHCASSCNNYIMIKQLVENGACIFATTFSKGETAASLFDDIHGFEQARSYMELAERSMGFVNSGKAENEDELDFEEGEELKVICRFDIDHLEDEDEDEEDAGETSYDAKFWWLCEKTTTGQRGLVPRNYFSLYPTWKHRERLNFTHFELVTSRRDEDEKTGKEEIAYKMVQGTVTASNVDEWTSTALSVDVEEEEAEEEPDSGVDATDRSALLSLGGPELSTYA